MMKVLLFLFLVFAHLTRSSNAAAEAAEDLFDILGIDNLDNEPSVYAKIAPYYSKKSDKEIRRNEEGYTLFLTHLPVSKEQNATYKELFARPKEWANIFLTHHTLYGQLTIEELVEHGSAESSGGNELVFKCYPDPKDESALIYTVNGILVERANLSVGPEVIAHYIRAPLWFPSSAPKNDPAKEVPKGKAEDPMTKEIADIFGKATGSSPDLFKPFLHNFNTYSGIGNSPFTMVKPPDTKINSWTKAFQFMGPAAFPGIMRQFSEYVVPHYFGPADLKYADSVTNLAGTEVPITAVGDYRKYGDVLLDPKEVSQVADGSGFIMKDVKPTTVSENYFGPLMGRAG